MTLPLYFRHDFISIGVGVEWKNHHLSRISQKPSRTIIIPDFEQLNPTGEINVNNRTLSLLDDPNKGYHLLLFHNICYCTVNVDDP